MPVCDFWGGLRREGDDVGKVAGRDQGRFGGFVNEIVHGNENPNNDYDDDDDDGGAGYFGGGFDPDDDDGDDGRFDTSKGDNAEGAKVGSAVVRC